jgi:hypothetical protein
VLGAGHIEPAAMNAAARQLTEGHLTYPAEPGAPTLF